MSSPNTFRDRLTAERTIHDRRRNLIVAATGTGKTLVAAFDYKRQIGPDGLKPRLLFLAHREELLDQARTAFRQVLRDASFGEILAGGSDPESPDHLFATIQSLTSRGYLEKLGPSHWDFAVIDECHHTPAKSFRDVASALAPRILLGLTATPERTDGEDVLAHFDRHIAAEIRLWHALDQQLLAPFEYYGLHDAVDLTKVGWSRGGYDLSGLDAVYTGNDERARLVLAQLARFRHDVRRARALGFCVSVAHAEFMAKKFTDAGIPALAVHGGSTDEVRDEARARLERREVNVLFTCDLYNEGIDLPFVDTLLLLRPTASATVFLQQLGRGLRLHEGKSTCLVLDFIGQSRREFRFDRLLTALTGVPRGRLKASIEEEFPTLPAGCFLRFDKDVRKIVLENVRQALGGGRERLTRELREIRTLRGRAPSLAEFLEDSGRELSDVYAAGGWTALRRNAGVLPSEPPEGEADLGGRFHLLQHIDEPARLRLYQQVLDKPPRLSSEDRTHLLMLGYQLFREHKRRLEPEEILTLLAPHPELRAELRELFALLEDQVDVPTLPPPTRWPLALHHRYSRREILTAVGRWIPTAKPDSREGVLSLKSENTDLFFVTLEKTEKSFSPTTRYRDYAISPTLFHWQSQSTTSDTSPTARRYFDPSKTAPQFLLFVRARQDDAYSFLGPVHHVTHEGSRPISITWRLEVPIPSALFQQYATLAAA